MADDKTPVPDKKRRRAKPATASKAISNTVIADTKVATAYDSQSYGIFKMRLTDQSSQIKKMADYSEDTAIRLTDIYEILKNMKPAPYVSSLDTYFNENGYIPVKVINPCCDENSTDNADKDKNKKRNKSFAEYVADFAGAIVPALAYAASLMHADEPANADAISAVTEEPVTAPADPMGTGNEGMNLGQATPDAVSTRRIATPKMHPHSVVAKREPLAPTPIQEIGSAPAITNPTTAQSAAATQAINRPSISTRVPPEPVAPVTSVAKTSPTLPNSLTKYLDNPYSTPAGTGPKRGVPANIPDLGMPGQGGGGGFPSVFGEEDTDILDNVSYKKSEDALGNYGISKDNTDNTILTARKINFIAKEITYEANKFEFTDQSGTASSSGSSSGGMGGGLSQVSFNPQESAVPGGGYNISNKTVATGSLKENQAEAYKAAIEGGLNDAAAKALVANMSGEALNKPGDVHWDVSHYAHGIVQWDDNRAEKIKQHFGKYPQDMTVAEQTKAAIWEIQSDYPGLWESMKTDDAASIVGKLVSQYERPADTQGATQQRLNYLSGLPDDLGVTKKAETSNELSPHADVASKSASTTMELNKPPAAPTAAPAVSSPSIINVSSPAASVDEPWAAFHDMFDMLDDATLAKNPWV